MNESHETRAKKIIAVIPARYASTRFPGKPLADLSGKSMIQRVFDQAKKSTGISRVVVATDDARIFDHVNGFGGEACMTSPDHFSGTDRCSEVLTRQTESFDYLINIQGDEPFIDPAQINLLISLLDGSTELATLMFRITSEEDLFNPNVVKVIANHQHEAIYFSRAALPYVRNIERSEWMKRNPFYKHIGLYGYRCDILKRITMLPSSMLEKAESLEQLRWIENGLRIRVAETDAETIGIDTADDLKKAIDFLRVRGSPKT